MLLRDHPLLNYRGSSSWPPVWTWIAGSDNQRPRGEIGILKSVTESDIEPADRCFLYIDHEGSSYLGCLLCSDHVFGTQLVKVLKANCNKTLADIGGLDLTHTL